MSLLEELKYLTRIKRIFSGQLNDSKSTQKGYHFAVIISKVNSRIVFVLDTIHTKDDRLKEYKINELQDSRSKWFNILSREMLFAISAEETRGYTALTEILYVFKDFLK